MNFLRDPVIVILGAGQIGSAVLNILDMHRNVSNGIKAFSLYDQYPTIGPDNPFKNAEVYMWDAKASQHVAEVIDFATIKCIDLRKKLQEIKADYVINALPFTLNENVAAAAVGAGCHYIDFTEDDIMADRVKQIYSVCPELNVAVKCGLAPGFINYVGLDLAKRIDKPHTLMIGVGALPRNVRGKDPSSTYNLSWSVDGLVNEYLRPCHVRLNGQEKKIPAITGIEPILIDGVQYEAAFTSGGVGSLVNDLATIPNVYYKTLRYPGHYDYVQDAVKRHLGDFDKIKKEFLSTFPFNRDDVIVVYAECCGVMNDGTLRTETFAERYVGKGKLSAIQSTTAGAGVAILELMFKGKVKGCITHSSIPLELFKSTSTFNKMY